MGQIGDKLHKRLGKDRKLADEIRREAYPCHRHDGIFRTHGRPTTKARRPVSDQGSTTRKLCKVWIEQCDAARRVEGEFGTPNALAYLVGEKFLNFLEAAESQADFRAEIPTFAAEIRATFEPWQLAEHLETARPPEPFDPALYNEDEDPEGIEMDRQEDIQRSARNLLLVERARGWLLDGDE